MQILTLIQKFSIILEVVILCFKYRGKCDDPALLRWKYQLECELCKNKTVIFNNCLSFGAYIFVGEIFGPLPS